MIIAKFFKLFSSKLQYDNVMYIVYIIPNNSNFNAKNEKKNTQKTTGKRNILI